MPRNGTVADRPRGVADAGPRLPARRGGPPRIIVTASSAGGLQALQRMLAGLPRDLAAAVLVVQHRSAARGSILEKMLQRYTSLRVLPMQDGMPVEAGCVYVAPPDVYAALMPDATLALCPGRRMRHVRSVAHPLFSSAAAVYGTDAIGVVLAGSGAEATEGVQPIKQAGGIVVAQDEATAHVLAAPRHAIATGSVTYVLPIGEIGLVLTHLVGVTTDYGRP